MSVFGGPINWLKERRRISPSAWISDYAALQKMIQLCSACLYKMPRHWTRTHHYAEFHLYHGVGMCDGCRHEDTITIFVSTDDPYYAACERQTRISRAIDEADRQFAMTDRRRVA